MKIVRKYNKLGLGLIGGIVLPLLAFVIIWQASYNGSLREYIIEYSRIHKLSSLISLSVIPNLLFFFLFIWTERYRSARGVLLATFVFALIIAIIKFT